MKFPKPNIKDMKAKLQKEKAKKYFLANVRTETRHPKTGGQQASICRFPVTLISDELGVEITIDFHTSGNKNKELAFTLMGLAIDELIK